MNIRAIALLIGLCGALSADFSIEMFPVMSAGGKIQNMFMGSFYIILAGFLWKKVVSRVLLRIAVNCRSVRAVRLLLFLRAELGHQTRIFNSFYINDNNKEIIHALLQDLRYIDPACLLFACAYNDFDLVDTLLYYGVDATKACCKKGQKDPILDLLGRTNALHYACYNGNRTIIDKLLKAGIDINQEDHNSKTPLFFACQSGGGLSIVPYLIEKRADNKRDENNKSVFYRAIEELKSFPKKYMYPVETLAQEGDFLEQELHAVAFMREAVYPDRFIQFCKIQGVNMHCRDEHGQRPVDNAITQRNALLQLMQQGEKEDGNLINKEKIMHAFLRETPMVSDACLRSAFMEQLNVDTSKYKYEILSNIMKYYYMVNADLLVARQLGTSDQLCNDYYQKTVAERIAFRKQCVDQEIAIVSLLAQ